MILKTLIIGKYNLYKKNQNAIIKFKSFANTYEGSIAYDTEES